MNVGGELVLGIESIGFLCMELGSEHYIKLLIYFQRIFAVNVTVVFVMK